MRSYLNMCISLNLQSYEIVYAKSAENIYLKFNPAIWRDLFLSIFDRAFDHLSALYLVVIVPCSK